MADNDDLNDEYQFADLDSTSPSDENPVDSEEATDLHKESPSFSDLRQNKTIMKGLIVVGVIIVLIMGYKLVGTSSDKKILKQPPLKPQATVSSLETSKVAPVVQQQAFPLENQATTPVVDAKVSQKLSALESTQQSIQTDVSAVSNQLGGVSKNVDALIAKINDLNVIISNLGAKVDEQSREIDRLTIQRHRLQAKKIQRPGPHFGGYPKYYIQAVIPGRAWLIATNGATLTVREGTVIAGYGTVNLIDPNQGRVTTSSGQVIRFSQEDS